MSSIKGKADLWRFGKNGAGPNAGKKNEVPGGGDKFQETSRFSDDRSNLPSSLDNRSVFANSTAGLAKADKPFMPNPGSGRDGLDMYAIKSSKGETGYGLDMAKVQGKKDSEF